MRDELYINNQPVDIGDTGIYLDYKSYLVFDIKKLIASNSYTIKLPKTANNMRIINCAGIVSSTSTFPYLKHKAQLVRDGVMLIDDADVALVSAGDSIEISLVWNKYPKLEAMQDVNLNEMPYELDNTSNNTEYYSWYGVSIDGTDTRTQDKRFPRMELGQRWRNNYRHPVISIYDIMRKIERYYSLSFNYPSDAVTRLKSLVIPILNRNVAKPYTQQFSLTGGNGLYTNTSFVPLTTWEIPSIAYEHFTQATGSVGGWNKPFINQTWNATYKVRITGTICVDVVSPPSLTFDELFVCIRTKNIKFNAQGNGNYGEEEKTLAALYRDTTSTDNHKFVIDEEVELPTLYTESLMQFTIVTNATGDETTYSQFIAYNGNLTLQFSPSIEKVEPLYSNEIMPLPFANTHYYIVPNLPKIKIVDFVKSVAQVFGWFCYEKNDVIYFRSYNTLADNVGVKDWSDYYLEETASLSYVVDDALTKKSKFVFANADDYPETSATIELDAETLSSKETNYVESKFSAANNASTGGNAYIPVYSYKDNWDSEKESIYDRWQYDKNDKAYLLTLENEQVGNKTYYNARFKETWTSIINNYWQTYMAMVNNGKVITCQMLLNPVVLKDIDLSVPVYLRQHSAYFVIQEIKTKENDIAEVKLIKLT